MTDIDWEAESYKKQIACEQMGRRVMEMQADVERLRSALREIVEFKASAETDFTKWPRLIRKAERALEGKE
jgi:hypothetical protein